MDYNDETVLHFDVSSGLKSVLGSDLITDDEVAIFELVKNSFDADAKNVDIYFDDDLIVVADDGIGMSYDDIENKWLFVAYSSKKISQQYVDFRDTIADKKYYAGSKGIGRFSSDRLGRKINLQTRSKKESLANVHSVSVNWDRFDEDHKEHFDNIAVDYSSRLNEFEFPNVIPKREFGTIIRISEMKQVWDRDKLLRIKSALAKLINPFGSKTDQFKITIYAPKEKSNDEREIKKIQKEEGDASLNLVVNGEVGNFIFSTLQEKTTFIEVSISKDGKEILSSLIDRGELIYKIKEPNNYDLLSTSELNCQLYFLNQSAKITFARRMGVPSVQFGSVFLFRNGFRVFPIGEDGDDWFKMDRRKQQGYARFLGTRDVIGRIDVSGSDEYFQESSSRNTGLIETPAVEQLHTFFIDFCLKRLERYVVPVTFVDKEDKNTSDISRLLTDPAKARVASVVAKLVDNNEVDLLDYSKKLIGILNEKSSQFESSLLSLRAIAEKTKDKNLFDSLEDAEKKFYELRRSENSARLQADQEREAKEQAQQRAMAAEKKVKKVTDDLNEEKKKNLFLSSIATLDTDTILNLHHQVTIYSVDIQQQIENFIVQISIEDKINKDDIINALERISLLNRKIMGISKFATKANFRLQSEMIEADMGEYIEQYINDIARQFLLNSISVEVSSDNKGFIQKFKPIDVSVVIDNLIANARKKNLKASKITFNIVHPSKNTMHIVVTDDGKGFDKSIELLDKVFEKGFTTTEGSGLGLFHVRQVLGEMNGTIEATKNENQNGATFVIRISK